MKQFVFNSSYTSNPIINISSTNYVVRLNSGPSALSSSYFDREALFVSVPNSENIALNVHVPNVDLISHQNSGQQLAFTSTISRSGINVSRTTQITQGINLPARRKRLRSLARYNGGSKSGIVNTSLFFLHQSNFFNKGNSKLITRPTNYTRRPKKSHVPLLLNSKESENATKTQRFGASWENGLTVATNTSFTSILSLLSGTQVNFVILPALALARYAFDFEATRSLIRNKTKDSSIPITLPLNSVRFLRHLEQERSSRFQYVAVQIPDLLRVSFTCRYFKKPAVLATLFAQTLSSLPRNRKETQFLRFLRKVVKVFSAQRTERLGVRLRFKGRVNR
jgi:hypothetical protein